MAIDGERKFETHGVHHIALVCKNMARTVHFYRDILGFPLTKTLEIPDDVDHWASGMQHFFFDIGNDTQLAFFWYPHAPEAIEGVTNSPPEGGITAHASMNHLALTVPEEMLEVYRQRLLDAGIDCSAIKNHDDSTYGVSPEVNETTYVRSIYFVDPDGVRLEFAAWVRELTEDDILVPAAEADSVPAPSKEGHEKTPA